MIDLAVQKLDDAITATPIALGNSWMAYADAQVCQNEICDTSVLQIVGTYQSCGGVVVADSGPSVTSHVITAAKVISLLMYIIKYKSDAGKRCISVERKCNKCISGCKYIRAVRQFISIISTIAPTIWHSYCCRFVKSQC